MTCEICNNDFDTEPDLILIRLTGACFCCRAKSTMSKQSKLLDYREQRGSQKRHLSEYSRNPRQSAPLDK